MSDEKCVEFGSRDATERLKDVVKLPISEDACFENPKDVVAPRVGERGLKLLRCDKEEKQQIK